MGPLTTYKTYRRMFRAQFLDRDAIRNLQEQKLRSLVWAAAGVAAIQAGTNPRILEHKLAAIYSTE